MSILPASGALAPDEFARLLPSSWQRSATVPEACFGIVMNAAEEVVDLAASGRQVKWAKGHRMFLVRDGALDVVLAPDPEAPEAGLRLALRPKVDVWPIKPDINSLRRLLRSLSPGQASLRVDDVRRDVVLHVQRSLPLTTLMQQEDLDSACQQLKGTLRDNLGFDCDTLEPVDLAALGLDLWSAIESPDADEPPESTSSQDDAAAAPAEPEEAATRAGSRTASHAFGASLKDMSRIDERARDRLIRELPVLAATLRALPDRAMPPELAKRVFDASAILLNLPLRVSAWPTLHSRWRSSLADAQVPLRQAQSSLAALDDLRARLLPSDAGSPALAPTAVDAAWCDELERLIACLASGIRARLELSIGLASSRGAEHLQ